jgi:hypothetical protein
VQGNGCPKDGMTPRPARQPRPRRTKHKTVPNMKKACSTLLGLAAIAALALSTTTTFAGPTPKKTKIDMPTITCGSSTEVSININVCAGATGLPAGFSIQWMTLADYVANGNQWYLSDDPRLCKASLSGNANLSRYNLAAGQCVSVNIGEFLLDEGASFSCQNCEEAGDGFPCALICGTVYVFHAFGHATSTLNRSDFTANLTCSTLACENEGGGCTLTQGYWKTHNLESTQCVPDADGNVGPLCVSWPVTSLTLGSVNYTEPQLVSILDTPASGNGLIALAHQLIAAKLNIANGADGTAVAQAIADADALIGGLVVPPVGSGSLPASATSALITALTNYNEGATGPGHCD